MKSNNIKSLFVLTAFALSAGFVFGKDFSFVMPYIKESKVKITRAYDSATHKNDDTYALDFDLVIGDKVVAIEDGTIEIAFSADDGSSRSYGNYIDINHSNSFKSRYAHLDKILVKKGDKVERGQIIGEAGNTGNVYPQPTEENPTAGDHLHFVIYQIEKYKDGAGKEREKIAAYKPEPLYNCVDQIEENKNKENKCKDFAAGRGYVSLNEADSSSLVGIADSQDSPSDQIAKKEQNNDSQNNNSQTSQEKPSPLSSPGNFIKGFTDNAVNAFMSVPNTIKNVGEEVGNKVADLIKPNNGDGKNGKIAGEISSTTLTNGETDSKKQAPDKEKTFEEKYNAQLAAQAAFGRIDIFSKNITLFPEQETTLSIQYKNTGTESWQKNNVFLNYTGPQTRMFYHPLWITQKRPSGLDQNTVRSGELGGFTFPVKAPAETGFYVFSVRPIVFVSGDFQWLGGDIASWKIEVAPKLVLENETNKPEEIAMGSAGDNKGKIKGILDFNTNGEDKSKNDNEKQNPPISGSGRSGSGGGSSCCGGGDSGGSSTLEINIDENNTDADNDNQEEISDIPETENAEIPETYLSEYPVDLTAENSAKFSFYSDIENTVFQCQIDGGGFADCSSPTEYNNLGDGKYKFEVAAISGEKEDSTPAEHIWTIDTTPPEKIADLKVESTENGKANLNWTLPEKNLSKITLYCDQKDKCGNENFCRDENCQIIEIPLSNESNLHGAMEISNLEKNKNYCFAAKSTDKAGNDSVLSDIAVLSQNHPPQAEITSPQNNAVYFEGENVNFTSEISDAEDGEIENENIIWKANGLEIGVGSDIVKNDFSIGDYEITLEVADSDGEKTIREVSVKIISSAWSEPIIISGLNYDNEFSIDIDGNDKTHLAIADDNYCENGNCAEAILYQNQTNADNNDFSSPAQKIIDVEDRGFSGISDLTIKVDLQNIIHLVFRAYSLVGKNYGIYYTNSIDGFNPINEIMHSGLRPQFALGDDDSLHIAATDNANAIYYAQCRTHCLFKDWEMESYELEEVFEIYDLSLAIDKNNNPRFSILADEEADEGMDFSPMPSLADQSKEILLSVVIPQNLNIFYLDKTSGNWNVEKIEGSYSLDTNVEIGFIGSSPVITLNDEGDLYQFIKNENNWSKNKIELQPLPDGSPLFFSYDFSFKTDRQNYSSIVSATPDLNPDLRWVTDYPNNIFKAFQIQIDKTKISYISSPKLAVGNEKSAVVFSGYDLEKKRYNVYYVERKQ